jgi:hypothetical protein
VPVGVIKDTAVAIGVNQSGLVKGRKMCGYSLYWNKTRLAEEGEELILHKFETGTLGFAAVADITKAEAALRATPDTFWAKVKDLFRGRAPVSFPAICVPPGTRLLLSDLPVTVQKSLYVEPSETVIFTQISERAYSYRDALLLPNGTRVLLQDLPEGIHALVLSMSPESLSRPVQEELRVA